MAWRSKATGIYYIQNNFNKNNLTIRDKKYHKKIKDLYAKFEIAYNFDF